MSLSHLYKHTVALYSMTNSKTAFGTADATYAVRTASVPCLLQHIAINEFQQFGKMTAHKPVIMFCDYTTVIDKSDRVISASGHYAGTYEIRAIRDPGGQAQHLEIDLEILE